MAERVEKRETVLLAEDEEGIRKLVCRVLGRQGYTVIAASDGPQAFEAAQRHEGPIHLLVADIVLPHFGGPELAKRLSAIHHQMKILFISGYAKESFADGVMPPDAVILGKPFTLEVLGQRIRELLDGKK